VKFPNAPQFCGSTIREAGCQISRLCDEFSVHSIRIKKAKLRKTKSLEKTALKILPKSAAYSGSELLL